MQYTYTTMTNVLQRQLQQLPAKPGVYRFFNEAGRLLYVGKAKSLKDRVRSYFHAGTELSPAKQLMVRGIHHVETSVMSNEDEALLLEATLIKQHQPPYNIDLKDDKNWMYFAIDRRESYPRVSLERKTGTRGVRYFGPYPSAGAARATLQLMKKTLGLRTCQNPPGRPCFAAGLGRCLGHDLGPGSRASYRKQLARFECVLKGEVREAVAELTKDMGAAAQTKQYERAARLRDQLRSLERLLIKQNVVSANRESFDLFAVARGSSSAAVAKLPVRKGALLETDRFLLEHTNGLTESEVLSGFLEQYYAQATDRPRRAYVSARLPEKRIGVTALEVPQRGRKRQLLRLAHKTAESHLTQSAASWERREVRAQTGMKELQERLGLPALPQRVEGYDISNIQGKEAVGAMVVLTNGMPDPKHYRKFRIDGFGGSNDFAMLAHMVVRRFTKNRDWPRPDLVMLDGGAGQLSVVQKALRGARVQVPLVALAKREEQLYLPGRARPLKLPSNNSGLLLLMELRDEAHRFGITFYRSRHRKANVRSQWDELPGVGPVLKKKLKAAFGSLASLRKAQDKDVELIVGKERARSIRERLG